MCDRPTQNSPQETALLPRCDRQARRARRKRAQNRRRIVNLFVTPVLLAGTVSGAYWGGRALRQAAREEPPALSAAVPLANSLDQVAENGTASGHKNRSSLSTKRDSDGSAATLQTVYELVKEHYVDALPTDRVLAQGAVRSLLQSLNDPNSQFLEPKQRQILENESKGKFGGIGANLAVRAQKQSGYTEYKLVVVCPLPGSPAERAGLHAGDVITHISGKWVLGYDPFLKASKLAQKAQTDSGADEAEVRKTYEAARAQTRGGIGLFAAQMALKGDETVLQAAIPTGRAVLTVQRAGVAAPLSFTVPFKETEVVSVASKPLPGNIGYVKINTLSDATPGAFANALQNTPHAGGLVVDLRNNAGGSIDAAQAIDGFLPLSAPTAAAKSTVPFGYEMQGQARQLVPLAAMASKVQAAAGTAPKLVVLVNEGTASSAEALAAALIDRHGATLVGGGSTKRTFGDASIQTLYPLSDGSAFTLTTGEWLTGRKQSWAGRGLAPRFVSPPVSVSVSVSAAAPPDPALTQAVALLQTSPTPAPPVRHAARSVGRTRGRGL